MIGGFVRFLAILSSFSWADSEIVEVAHRDLVDLKPFVCQDITRSTVISRVCYDKSSRYMLVQLSRTYHGFCAIPDQVVTKFLNAPSMGKFFKVNIQGIGPNSPYHCDTFERTVLDLPKLPRQKDTSFASCANTWLSRNVM